MADRIQQRRDTAARWSQFNPILLEGEVGYVTDNPNQYKIGDGVRAWNDLPLRGYNGTVVQNLGTSENEVMSQNGVRKSMFERTSYAMSGNNVPNTVSFKDDRVEITYYGFGIFDEYNQLTAWIGGDTTTPNEIYVVKPLSSVGRTYVYIDTTKLIRSTTVLTRFEDVLVYSSNELKNQEYILFVFFYNNVVMPTTFSNTLFSKSIQNSIIGSSKKLGFNFTGSGSKFVFSIIRSTVIGRYYRVTFPRTTWPLDVTETGINPLEMYCQIEDNQFTFFANVNYNDFKNNGIAPSYTFRMPETSVDNYLYVGGYANEDEEVYFQLEDVTDEITSVVKLTGSGNTGNEGGITEQGQTYLNPNQGLRYCTQYEPSQKYDPIPFSMCSVYLYQNTRLFWDGENLVERGGDTFSYDDFNSMVKIRNCGKMARVYEGQYIKSLVYRAIWIKVKAGDTINMLSFGYTDNVNIAFSLTKTLDNLIESESSKYNGYLFRSCYANEDGWVLCNWVERRGEEPNCYIWNDSASLKLEDNIQQIPGYVLSASKLFVYSTSQTQSVFKVSKGDFVALRTKQYSDTNVIAFSKKYPVFGATVDEVVSGYKQNMPVIYSFVYTVKEDGYLLINPLMGGDDYFLFNLLRANAAEPEYVKDYEDSIDMCRFISVDAEDQRTTGAVWTGNEIIENIYEPLRLAHPEYITRKSLGKDASGQYDIWLYEFNNSVDEWFSLSNKEGYYNSASATDNVLLPNTNGMSSKQFCVQKDFFDRNFKDDYFNLYATSKVNTSDAPTKVISIEEGVLINNKTYYRFTCEEDVYILNPGATNSGIQFWWTKKVETCDQTALIVSGTHADENGGYLGTALALKYMIEHHEENAGLDYIFRHVKLLVVPILNIWGSNQTPKVRANYLEVNLNCWDLNNLTPEQEILFNLMKEYKDELSFFADYHTAEWWLNYGVVYSITKSPLLRMGAVRAQNFFLKSWFKDKYQYNWNSGAFSGDGRTPGNTNTNVIMQELGVDGITAEFAGYDLINFSGCQRYDATYMKYAIETYINYMISFCSLRIRNNTDKLFRNKFFVHTTMT